MPYLKFEYQRLTTDTGAEHPAVVKDVFTAISPSWLGLGDLKTEGRHVEALAAVFDLEGFTRFCNQVDAHLVVPEFIVQYLDWLFDEIKSEFKRGETDSHTLIWGALPFFVKFMGDGLLVLWDTSLINDQNGIRNVIVTLWDITRAYQTRFYPLVYQHMSSVPRVLRCGVARGTVLSIGEDGDFVGSCINIASRLQKMPGLTFAASRRGISLPLKLGTFWGEMVVKQVSLRGIGEDERIYVHATELAEMQPADRIMYGDLKGVL
jgi:class 3 adenylate cyclase